MTKYNVQPGAELVIFLGTKRSRVCQPLPC